MTQQKDRSAGDAALFNFIMLGQKLAEALDPKVAEENADGARSSLTDHQGAHHVADRLARIEAALKQQIHDRARASHGGE